MIFFTPSEVVGITNIWEVGRIAAPIKLFLAPQKLDELYGDHLCPEAVFALVIASDESDVATLLGCKQYHIRVRRNIRVSERIKRNERVVLGVNQ